MAEGFFHPGLAMRPARPETMRRLARLWPERVPLSPRKRLSLSAHTALVHEGQLVTARSKCTGLCEFAAKGSGVYLWNERTVMM